MYSFFYYISGGAIVQMILMWLDSTVLLYSPLRVNGLSVIEFSYICMHVHYLLHQENRNTFL